MKKFFENLKILYMQLTSKKEQAVARQLFSFSLTVATAESCTGGLISSRLTDISGSSTYVKENFITYSEDAKVDTLGVDREVLEEYGVISKECAMAMAEGLFRKTNRDICLSITGVAGPQTAGGRPAGTAYIAIKNKYNIEVKELKLNSHLSRRTLKFLFSEEALTFLLEFIKSNYQITQQ